MSLRDCVTLQVALQAAAHSEVFHVLRDNFDCRFECFASPFNCRYTRYCSMFPDTDGPFGSSGSFFRFAPTTGSFQANPPFDKQFVDAMADHMFKLLGTASVRSCARDPPGAMSMCRRAHVQLRSLHVMPYRALTRAQVPDERASA